MFKKIEIWILYLFFLLSFPVIISYGFLVKQELVGKTKFGPVSKTALFLAEIPTNFKKILISEKRALEVEDRFPLLDGFNGTPNSQESFLLLSRFDGTLNEGIVELIDLKNFNVLHTWNPDIDKFNEFYKKEEFKYLKRDKKNSKYLLKNPLLLNDGSLVFKYNSPIRKIDSCSNLLLDISYDNFHHSLEKDIDGNIWVPSHMYPQSLPVEKVGRAIIEEGGYYDDAIVKLSPEGTILYEKSVSQIFIDNGLEYLLFAIGDSNFNNDPIHLNDIQPVDFDGDFWQKGDVFLSLRNQSMVLLFRPITNKIIWKGTGRFFQQHDVNILNNHAISVFNNNKKDLVNGNVTDGHNEVIIYDFKKDKYSTYLNKSLEKYDVRTVTNGRGEILKNGDLIVEETEYGRTLYFNSDGSLKWTYLNRADNNNVYRLGWARILYDYKNIQIVKNFLQSRINCND